jgi:hypothetical protein
MQVYGTPTSGNIWDNCAHAITRLPLCLLPRVHLPSGVRGLQQLVSGGPESNLPTAWVVRVVTHRSVHLGRERICKNAQQ